MDANVAEVQLVMALAEAKSRQSIEDALAIYHPDGVLECPPWGTVSRGDELRGALEAFFWLAPDYEAQLDGMAADRGTSTWCAWGSIAFTPTASFRGDPPDGRRVRTPVFILFRFRDERIVWESFHFDPADVARQCGVSPEAFVPRVVAA